MPLTTTTSAASSTTCSWIPIGSTRAATTQHRTMRWMWRRRARSGGAASALRRYPAGVVGALQEVPAAGRADAGGAVLPHVGVLPGWVRDELPPAAADGVPAPASATAQYRPTHPRLPARDRAGLPARASPCHGMKPLAAIRLAGSLWFRAERYTADSGDAMAPGPVRRRFAKGLDESALACSCCGTRSGADSTAASRCGEGPQPIDVTQATNSTAAGPNGLRPSPWRRPAPGDPLRRVSIESHQRRAVTAGGPTGRGSHRLSRACGGLRADPCCGGISSRRGARAPPSADGLDPYDLHHGAYAAVVGALVDLALALDGSLEIQPG